MRPVDDHYDSASGDESWVFTGELEIATVYKPRPQRRRTPEFATSPSRNHLSKPTHASVPLDVPYRNYATGSRKDSGKLKWNRHKRNGRKAKGRSSGAVVTVEETIKTSVSNSGAPPTPLDDPDHPPALDELAEAAALLSIDNNLVPSATPELYEPVALSIEATRDVVPEIESTERRFIVEALVVRKMSLEEAFLDFGNI